MNPAVADTRALDTPSGPNLGCLFDNTYARELEGAYVPWPPRAYPHARLLKFNEALADALGITQREGLAEIFSGSLVPLGAAPLAQAYAGHQFGGFSPSLGDGRALLLGEVIDRHGVRRDIALKGSGRTPFSRGGDGLAAVGPMLREYLVSEAMHHLGIPTTRSLAVVATGETVWREGPLPGAVLTRVAASHLRVGTFQYFAARQETELLRRLLDYALARHDPDLQHASQPALALLARVCQRQAALVAQWMSVGFIHGVMNTDNMTISGETIDYGPCAFMERMDMGAVFSSIDHYGRYAYGNQPSIAHWNLTRLAEALLPLIDADQNRAIEKATEVLNAFPPAFDAQWHRRMLAKIGLHDEPSAAAPEACARTLVNEYLALMQAHEVDFTLGFRRLSAVLRGQPQAAYALHARDVPAFEAWVTKWLAALGTRDRHAVAAAMDAVNPIAIARNHLVEAALAAATEHGDLRAFDRLLAAVSDPMTEHAQYSELYEPAPAAFTQTYQTFCGT